MVTYKHVYVPFMQSDRLNKVLGYVNEVHALCGVLGVDFSQTVCEVHPSLHRTDQEQSTNISDSTLEGLEHMIQKLKTERKARFQKVASSLLINMFPQYHPSISYSYSDLSFLCFQ